MMLQLMEIFYDTDGSGLKLDIHRSALSFLIQGATRAEYILTVPVLKDDWIIV